MWIRRSEMSVFEEACYLSNQRWTSSLPLEFEEIKFSKQHEKRMRILFDKMRRDKYHRFTKKVTISLIAAILIVSMTITAFAVPASRDFIIHKFFDHSTYTVVNGEHNEVGEITIRYVPEGFEIIDQYKDEKVSYIEYQDANEDWFQVRKMSLTLKTDIDTESYNYKNIFYNNKLYISYQNDSSKAFIWNDRKYEYTITGNVSNDLLLKIADSIS